MSIDWVLVFFLFVYISTFVIAYLYEEREWNKGFCRKCGTSWVYFDTDSQGGDGFHCSMGHSIWVSYPRIVDKKYKVKCR